MKLFEVISYRGKRHLNQAGNVKSLCGRTVGGEWREIKIGLVNGYYERGHYCIQCLEKFAALTKN